MHRRTAVNKASTHPFELSFSSSAERSGEKRRNLTRRFEPANDYRLSQHERILLTPSNGERRMASAGCLRLKCGSSRDQSRSTAVNRSFGPRSGQFRLRLGQNSLVLLEKPLQSIFVRDGYGGSLELPFEEFVMNQRLANQPYLQIRILHLPNLAALEWLEDDPTFSYVVLHRARAYQSFGSAKSYLCSGPPLAAQPPPDQG